MSDKLLPCPFCKGNWRIIHGPELFAECEGCGVTTKARELLVSVIRDVNTRPAVSGVEGLEECAFQLALLLNSIEAGKGHFHTNEASALEALKKIGVDIRREIWFGKLINVYFNETDFRRKYNALRASPPAQKQGEQGVGG